MAWAEQLQKAGGRRVLDLGCGIGRHTVALASRGFTVTATDVAPVALMRCAAWLARKGLSASPTCHEMGALPFPNCTFDGLIAYNVIYHTTAAGMQRTLAEMHRVLNPGGWLYTTVVAREDSKVAGYQTDVETGKCAEIEPFTFIYLHDAPNDKYLPHHYCDRAELNELLADFVVTDLCLDRREYTDEHGAIQASVHYHVQAQQP